MRTEAIERVFESHRVRIVMDERGEPWFVAADVCAALGLANARDAMSRLDPEEKGVANADTPGGAQRMTTVSEPGVYRLVFTSRVPGAERFKRWLAHEVLPSIRRTGNYGGPPVGQALPQDYEEALAALLASVREQKRLQTEVQQKDAELAEVRPAAALGMAITPKGKMWTVTEAARILRVQRDVELFPLLRRRGWISKDGVTGLVPYTCASGGHGYVDWRQHGTRQRSSGAKEPNIIWGITERGLRRIGEILQKRAEVEAELNRADGPAAAPEAPPTESVVKELPQPRIQQEVLFSAEAARAYSSGSS